MDYDAIIAAVKEIVRLAIFAAVAAFVTTAIGGLEALNSNELWVALLTMLLRFIDKYIHKNIDNNKNGLLPF